MANFTALKTAINNAIKTNGNEEITGAVLQVILDAMVETLGDSAINDLENAITTEVTNRENAVGGVADDLAAEALARANKDNQLDGRINQEEYNRANADAALSRTVDQGFQTLNSQMTALNAAISALNAAYQNGYLYGGIATPSSSPSNNKCFYIALQGGTYTNFGGVGVVQGINILKNDNGWKVEHIYDQTTLLNEFYLLRQQVIQAITSFAPIVIEGDVTNAPDEEDLTSNAQHLLQFKNNAYSPLEFSGLGRKYLRKNIAPLSESAAYNGFVEGVTAEETLSGTPEYIFWDRMNTRFVGIKDGVYYADWSNSDNYVPASTSLVYMYQGTPYRWDGSDFSVDETEVPNLVNCLTQDMINEANTIYIIRYDYTLKEDITIPDGCVLQFDGGSISGEHTIIGTNTGIQAGLVKIFSTNLTLAGTWNVAEAYPEWFGAKGDGLTDDTLAIQKCINEFNNIFLNRIYYLAGNISITQNNKKINCSPKCLIKSDYNQSSEGGLYNAIFQIDAEDVASETIEILSNDGHNGVTISDASIFNIGDMVSLMVGSSAPNDIVYNDFIIDISDNTIYLGHDLAFQEISHIRKHSYVENIHIDGNGCTIDFMGNQSKTNFIQCSYTKNSIIGGFKCINGGGKGVHILYSTNVKAQNMIHTLISIQESGKGESLLVEKSSGCVIDGCNAIRTGRGVDFASSVYCIVQNCKNYDSIFTTHGLKSKFITFENCDAYCMYARKSGTQYISAFTFGNASSGDGVGADYNIIVNNCRIYGGYYGIITSNYSGIEDKSLHTSHITISNCEFNNCGVCYAGGNETIDIQIVNCTFRKCTNVISGTISDISINGHFYECPQITHPQCVIENFELSGSLYRSTSANNATLNHEEKNVSIIRDFTIIQSERVFSYIKKGRVIFKDITDKSEQLITGAYSGYQLHGYTNHQDSNFNSEVVYENVSGKKIVIMARSAQKVLNCNTGYLRPYTTSDAEYVPHSIFILNSIFDMWHHYTETTITEDATNYVFYKNNLQYNKSNDPIMP